MSAGRVPTGHTHRVLADHPVPSDGYRSAVFGALRSALGRSEVTQLPRVALSAPPLKVPLDRLASYCELIGAPVTDGLPAGFVHVLGFSMHVAWLTGSGSRLPALGMVHISNRVTYWREVTEADLITFTVWGENLRPHRKGSLLDVRLLAEVDGELCWEGTSTYLASGVHTPGEPPPREEFGEVPDLPGLHTWMLPADAGRAYARASGDANPIHTSKLAAKAFGFSRPIIHGMYSAARALTEVGTPPVPFEWWVDFVKPLLLPGRAQLVFGAADAQEPGSVDYVLRGGEKLHLTGGVRPLDADGLP